MKTYNVTRKKENMWVVQHGAYHVDYKDEWSSEKRWMCDGYLIEKRVRGSNRHVVYTKWWWEKLAIKEKEEVVKTLQRRIQSHLRRDDQEHIMLHMWSDKKRYMETYGSEEGDWEHYKSLRRRQGIKLPIPIIHSLRKIDEDEVYIENHTRQLLRIKELLEKTGVVMKHEYVKDIPSLYDAVEFIETLDSPYKRKQLKQIVYYKPKRWVQALLGI